MSSSIEKLYECYEIVNNKDEKEESKKKAYQSILGGVNGDEKEKRLASQFISKFFKLFPDLYEVSFNKLLDLCEDENILIRKQVIQYLPSVGKSVVEYIPKIADTLTQMLAADDNSEIVLIYAALNNVLKFDFKVALEAIFHQLLTQLEEANELINTFAFKYLNEKLGTDCELQPEMETFIEAGCKKLLTKLVGKAEYSLVIGILSYLKVNSTLLGRQKLVNEITEQTKLLGPINEVCKFVTILSNCKQTVKLLSKNVHADDMLMYLLENMADIANLSAISADCSLYDLLKSIIDLSNRGKSTETGGSQGPTINLSTDDGLKCIESMFAVVLAQLPPVPDEVTEEVIVKLSEDRTKISLQEVTLLALYNLCKSRPDSLTKMEEESMKQFKQRLQLLARVNQATQKSVTECVSKMTKNDNQSDEGREKIVLSKVTSNIQVLIRELFKTAPSMKTVIIPSWNVSLEPSMITAGTKRSSTTISNNDDGSATADTGHSPPTKIQSSTTNNNNNNNNNRRATIEGGPRAPRATGRRGPGGSGSFGRRR